MESSASQTHEGLDTLNLQLEDHVEVWPWEFDKETRSYLWRRRTCPRCSRRRHLSLVEGPSRKRWLALDSLAWRHCLLPSKTSGPGKEGTECGFQTCTFQIFCCILYIYVYILSSVNIAGGVQPHRTGEMLLASQWECPDLYNSIWEDYRMTTGTTPRISIFFCTDATNLARSVLLEVFK